MLTIDDRLKVLRRAQLSALTTVQAVLSVKLKSLQARASGTEKTPTAAVPQMDAFKNLLHGLNSLEVQNKNLPKPSPDNFVIHGRVVDAQGKPLPGYALEIVASDTRKAIGEPLFSDHNGAFTASIPRSKFPETTNAQHGLMVTVHRPDKQRSKVFASTEAIRPAVGQIAVFSVVDRSSATHL